LRQYTGQDREQNPGQEGEEKTIANPRSSHKQDRFKVKEETKTWCLHKYRQREEDMQGQGEKRKSNQHAQPAA
jgi:hypothetical protein